jgi:hypothetical protein
MRPHFTRTALRRAISHSSILSRPLLGGGEALHSDVGAGEIGVHYYVVTLKKALALRTNPAFFSQSFNILHHESATIGIRKRSTAFAHRQIPHSGVGARSHPRRGSGRAKPCPNVPYERLTATFVAVSRHKKKAAA